MERILARLLARHPGVDPLTLLAERLSPSELRSLLLAIFRVRAARRTHIRDRVFAPLAAAHPEVHFVFDPGRLRQATYYTGLCFHVFVHGFPGDPVPIADGGVTDWTARLLGSGVGAELIARLLPRRQE